MQKTFISASDTVGVICRGGPVNGPFAAAALATLKRELADRGVGIHRLYGNSASASVAVLSAIDRDDVACDIWANLRPQDLILPPNGWWGRARTVWNLLNAEAIFDDSPLEGLIKDITPLDEVFSPDAIPVKIMAVDYLTGREVVATNKNPKHRWNFHRCILGSKALTPFLKCQVIYDVVEAELLDQPWTRVGPFADIAVLFDGGYSDNLMFDDACRDGCTVVFVIDINGLVMSPLATHRWNHWSQALQRAFHVLVTTNDNRRFHGVQRTNEVLAIRKDLMELRARPDIGLQAEQAIDAIVDRMTAVLRLEGKHHVTSILVEDRENSCPFDFATFTRDQSAHLLHSGTHAALRALEDVEVF